MHAIASIASSKAMGEFTGTCTGPVLSTRGADAAGTVVPPAESALVTLVVVPGVDVVTPTTIVHPPGGSVDPAGSVISVAVTVTFAHVPELPVVVEMPAGIGSVNGAVSVSGTGPALPSVIVIVADAPGTMRPGTIDLASDAVPVPTVSGALAGGALPPYVDNGPVVLVTVPAVDDVIVTTIVQPPGGNGEPAAMVTDVAVSVTPVQVPVLLPVVVTPAGIVSAKSAVNA